MAGYGEGGLERLPILACKPPLQFERRCPHARHGNRIAYMRPNDPAGVDEAGGYARAIRAEPIGYRIDIDAVEIMEQEQRARQRGQPPERGAPETNIPPPHDLTCAATAARQSRQARQHRWSTRWHQTPR